MQAEAAATFAGLVNDVLNWNDFVPGLGSSRKQALIKHFGSLKRLRAATIEEICEVPGVGRKTAETVAAALVTKSPGRTVNTATGEIVEEE